MTLVSTAARAGGSSGSVTLICSQTLGSAAANFDTNTLVPGVLPTSYSHLRAVVYVRSTDASATLGLWLRFNNDSGANYNYEQLDGTSAGVSAGATNNAAQIVIGNATGGGAPAGMAAGCTFDVLAYNATTFNKNVIATTGAKETAGGQNQVTVINGVWASTAAITRIQVIPQVGTWATGSVFSLYGLT